MEPSAPEEIWAEQVELWSDEGFHVESIIKKLSDETLDKSTTFLEAEKFIVHIASENQIELCKSFSKSANGESELIWAYNDEGDAFIENCSARFECIKYSHFDGGDHSIIVGEVKKFETTDHKPLVYLGGNYQKL